jgi:transposase
MGQALPLALRQEIVSLRQSGNTYRQISEQLHIGYATSKNIWYSYQREAEAGLQTKYANCGSKTKRSSAKMYRIVLWLKRLHPGWGAGRIRIGLLSRYDEKLIPSERTMQRWFKEKKPDQTTPAKGTAPHRYL